ncbi:hypothetical protein PY365_22155 [Roseiarcaceae bacterium H3SJ34-1]|nr:hypothetical protein [Roseiarcaceae bacterium H3SJ34-1]
MKKTIPGAKATGMRWFCRRLRRQAPASIRRTAGKADNHGQNPAAQIYG